MDNTILQVIVGSQAHGLANENSDTDYRGVFVTPTSKLLSLGTKYKTNSWIEGNEDNTMYEIGHFLHLATKCNASILEVFKAPIIQSYEDNSTGHDMETYWGNKLRDLFPYVWNPKDAYNAFTGYSDNQRKKMLDKKDGRHAKFAVAYIRTLLNLCDLLKTGDFSLKVHDSFKDTLLRFKSGNFQFGEVIDLAEILKNQATVFRDACNHKPNLDRVNDFLLEVRKEFWE